MIETSQPFTLVRQTAIYTGTFYKESVRSLFILAMRLETLRSIVRSPISTTRPPTMSGLTWARALATGLDYMRMKLGKKRHTSLVTLSFLPAPTYSDLATAVSSLERVLLSSC